MIALAIRNPIETTHSPLQAKQRRYWAALETAEPEAAAYFLDALHGMVSGPNRKTSFDNAERQALERNMATRIQHDNMAIAQGGPTSSAYALLHTLATRPEAGRLVKLDELAEDSIARVQDWAANIEAREQKARNDGDKERLTPTGMALMNLLGPIRARFGKPLPTTDLRQELLALATQDQALLEEGQPSFTALSTLQRYAAEGRIPMTEVAQVQAALAQNWINRSKLCGKGCDMCALEDAVALERGCSSVKVVTFPTGEEHSHDERF